MTDFIVAYTLCANENEAAHIAKTVVEERLAACANILPAINSFYWWEGKVQNSSEVALFIKTEKSKFEILQNRISQLHSYELPCIIALPIEMGEAKYLQWLKKEVE